MYNVLGPHNCVYQLYIPCDLVLTVIIKSPEQNRQLCTKIMITQQHNIIIISYLPCYHCETLGMVWEINGAPQH